VDVLLDLQEEGGKLSDDMISGTLSGILTGGVDSISG
jgi:hypothetical protein